MAPDPLVMPGDGSALEAGGKGVLRLDGETHFDRHLVVRDLAALDMAAGFGDFEPADVVDGRRGAGDRALDGVLDAGGRGADQLNDLVNVVTHELPSLR
jgi:hypothetical protein